MQLNVFDIQRGSYHDGPGIRTVVFLKGCNLSCFWCQNPESQDTKKQVLFYKSRCVECGACVEICPSKCYEVTEEGIVYHRENCIGCGACIPGCCGEALEMSGKMMSVDDVLAEIMKDEAYYRLSGGGMTVSGGEPLLQAEPLKELLKKAKEAGINTAIETAANVGNKVLEEVLPLVDFIFIDLKLLDSELHRKYCGCKNDKIIDNIKRVAEKGLDLTIRTPVIPGVNDDENVIREMALFVKKLGVKNYELLPFHKMGGNKYKALGLDYAANSLETISKNKIDELKKIVAEII